MKFVGYDGEIELIGNALKIKKGKKDVGRTILLTSVVSVTVIKPGFLGAGCIFVQVYGERTYEHYHNISHYCTDKNAICFRKKEEYDIALDFKEAIESAIAEPQRVAPVNDLSYVDEIRALKALVDDGIITQEDFEAKKKTLLGI